MQVIAKLLLLSGGLAVAAGCRPATGSGPEASENEPSPTALSCRPGGRLEADVYGSVEARIRWTGDQLSCEGMPRPDNAGARLRFSGHVDELNGSLAIIIALPKLERGGTLSESSARVTVIDEATGRFFSSADLGTCWSNVERQELAAGDEFYIEGIAYCVASLAEVNGPGSVRFGDIAFSGRVNWTIE